MKKIWTKEVKIGLTAILCMIIIFAGIQFLKGINVVQPINYYTITFKNVDELMVSAPVTVNGYKVGVVHDIKYDFVSNNQVYVMVNLDKELRIARDSKISLSKGLMGGASIVIDNNPYVSEFYQSGDTIEGINGNNLMNNVANMMPEIENIISKLDSILGGVQTLVNDPALLNAIQRMDGITANLESSSSQLDVMLRNDVPAIINNVTSITNNVDTLTTTLNRLPIEKTINDINQLIANLEEVSKGLNSTDNTAGLILNDKELYEKLNDAVISLDSLLIDIRLNPKRYINVKVF